MMNNLVALPEVVRTNDLAKIMRVHPQTIRNRMRDGSLPKQRRVGRLAPYWLASDLANVIGGTPAHDAPKAA